MILISFQSYMKNVIFQSRDIIYYLTSKLNVSIRIIV